MKRSMRSLATLAVGCTFAAALFGFGSEVLSFKSSYHGEVGRETLIQTSRIAVYLILSVLLVFRGGWPGVLAAFLMMVVATAIEWELLPVALGFAGIGEPAGYAHRFADFHQPSYWQWAAYDIIGGTGAAILARCLIMFAHVNPAGPRDE